MSARWTPELRAAWLSRPCRRCGAPIDNGERCEEEQDRNSHDEGDHGIDYARSEFPAAPPEWFVRGVRGGK